MKMQEVKSSNITHLGHEGNTLHVTYSSGHTYEFNDVTEDKFKALMGAESHGKHLHKMGIKGTKLKKD